MLLAAAAASRRLPTSQDVLHQCLMQRPKTLHNFYERIPADTSLQCSFLNQAVLTSRMFCTSAHLGRGSRFGTTSTASLLRVAMLMSSLSSLLRLPLLAAVRAC